MSEHKRGRPPRPTPEGARNRAVTLTEDQLQWLREHPGEINVSAAARAGIDRVIRAKRREKKP